MCHRESEKESASQTNLEPMLQIWMSGKTKVGHAVPWNVQSVNTHPVLLFLFALSWFYESYVFSRKQDNFMWEKDKVHITVAAPGLYEISFGFFARYPRSLLLFAPRNFVTLVFVHRIGKSRLYSCLLTASLFYQLLIRRHTSFITLAAV